MTGSSPDLKKFAVLYVDDEQQATKYFRKGLDKDFRILTATSVAEAITILEREARTIGVVITDQRMPGQTGVELLVRLRQQWPAIVRILITAYSDLESAVAAVNAGQVYKYITKPADFNLLRQTLTSALELHRKAIERDVLLKERMYVLRRMIVADRVRSVAALAGGITHHLRNSMTAMSCFLEEAAPSSSPPAAGPPPAAGVPPTPASDARYLNELLSLALEERQELIKIVERVGQSTVEPTCRFADAIELEPLVRAAAASVASELPLERLSLKIDPSLPSLNGDREMTLRLLKTLLAYVRRLSPADGNITVSAAAAPPMGDAPAIQLRITGNGVGWKQQDVASFFTPFAFPENDPADLGLELLVAFFIAYHHNGDLLVHRTAPAGPGFELILPVSPADVHRPDLPDHFFERLFTEYKSPEAA